jgi:hypothetical protein
MNVPGLWPAEFANDDRHGARRYREHQAHGRSKGLVMRFSNMNGIRWSRGVQALSLALAVTLASAQAYADTAYVAQIPANVVTTMNVVGAHQQVPSYAPGPSARPTSMFTPESGQGAKTSNFASTLQIGSRNSVYTLQAGSGNTARTGVIGNDNNVNVLQAGNNLKSNLVLMNGSNMNVSVIQPKGSAPVNVFIARLPGGGLLIKR